MSKVENVELIGGMIKHLAAHRGDLNTVFDLEDGFSKTVWMDNCVEKLQKDPSSAKMLEDTWAQSTIWMI